MHRDDAERRIASLPEETVDCMACKGPNCISGEITLCEPVTKTCIIVTEILDGGTTPPPSGMPDAGDMPAGSLGDGGTP
jgi:hypothetical protein